MALSAVAAAIASPAAAQFGPTIDEHTTVVKELVVRGYGGPAWWKVTGKGSTLYVLASPGELPAGVDFDHRLLDRRIGQSQALITSPRVSLGLGLVFLAPTGLRLLNQLNTSTKTDLEPTLPPAVRARFAAARTAIQRPETRYGALTPGLAAMALAGDTDVFRKSKTPPPKGGQSVEALAVSVAKSHKVKVVPAASYGSGMFSEFVGDLKKPGLPCMTAVLDDIEKPYKAPDFARQKAVAEAWAEGDVAPLLDLLRGLDGSSSKVNIGIQTKTKSVNLQVANPVCVNAMPVLVRMQTQYLTDQVDTLARLLAKPGQSVAVLDAGTLLMTGGILDQLRKRGFTVTAPDAS